MADALSGHQARLASHALTRKALPTHLRQDGKKALGFPAPASEVRDPPGRADQCLRRPCSQLLRTPVRLPRRRPARPISAFLSCCAPFGSVSRETLGDRRGGPAASHRRRSVPYSRSQDCSSRGAHRPIATDTRRGPFPNDPSCGPLSLPVQPPALYSACGVMSRPPGQQSAFVVGQQCRRRGLARQSNQC